MCLLRLWPVIIPLHPPTHPPIHPPIHPPTHPPTHPGYRHCDRQSDAHSQQPDQLGGAQPAQVRREGGWRGGVKVYSCCAFLLFIVNRWPSSPSPLNPHPHPNPIPTHPSLQRLLSHPRRPDDAAAPGQPQCAVSELLPRHLRDSARAVQRPACAHRGPWRGGRAGGGRGGGWHAVPCGLKRCAGWRLTQRTILHLSAPGMQPPPT